MQKKKIDESAEIFAGNFYFSSDEFIRNFYSANRAAVRQFLCFLQIKGEQYSQVIAPGPGCIIISLHTLQGVPVQPQVGNINRSVIKKLKME